MKLRLKPTIIPYQLPQRVVLNFSGAYAVIPDLDGSRWALTKSLDGNRTRAEIIDYVLTRFPDAGESDLGKVVDDFIQNNMVEIPEEQLNTSLTDYQRTRFARNIDFFGSMAATGDNKFAFQEKLLASKLCVLGCGGLGTHILFDLAALGIQHLTILDFDKIELSNLNRQVLYKEADIGTEKVETAKKRLLEFNSQLDIATHSMRLTCADDVARVIKGHDLVICVADKPANYIGDWLNEACVRHGVPYITGGLDVRRSVFFSVAPKISGCVECWLSSARSQNALDNDVTTLNKSQNITFESPAPAFVTLVAVTAGMMVSEAVKFITGIQEPQLLNKLKEFRFDDLSVDVAETWARNPECRICGHR